MEEKKFDPKTLIGYALIFAIAAWYIYTSPKPEPEIEEPKQEEVVQNKPTKEFPEATRENIDPNVSDSIARLVANQKLGKFGYSETLSSAKGGETLLENELLSLKISNKGGYITEAKLKNFKTYDSVPVYLIKDGKNASLSINFNTSDNRKLNTSNLYFQPELKK